MSDPMKQLWQNQQVEGEIVSLDEIWKKARKFQSRIRWRNAREFAGGVLVVIMMSYFAWNVATGLTRTAAIVCIAGILYVMIQLYRRGSAGRAPTDIATANWLEFHRRELERQRDLLRSVWSWYIAPLVPGLALYIVAGLLEKSGRLDHREAFVAGYAVVLIAALAFIVWLNRRAARRLQHSIDELNAMGRGQ